MYVKQVLQVLEQASLYLKLQECEFYIQEVRYLCLNIITKGMWMDAAKVAAIKE